MRAEYASLLHPVQYALGVSDKELKEEIPQDRHGNILPEWPLREFYLFGTSTANIRIELWWRQLRKGQVGAWLVRIKLSTGECPTLISYAS
jgi:hypothetical protein